MPRRRAHTHMHTVSDKQAYECYNTYVSEPSELKKDLLDTRFSGWLSFSKNTCVKISVQDVRKVAPMLSS